MHIVRWTIVTVRQVKFDKLSHNFVTRRGFHIPDTMKIRWITLGITWKKQKITNLDSVILKIWNNSNVHYNDFKNFFRNSQHLQNMLCTKIVLNIKTKTTICVHNMFCRYSELTIFMNNEQSVVILWVSWCKNKSIWQKFTCTIQNLQRPPISETTYR